MKILFAPVGGTDPISESNYYEGPILQITRHFQPDIIYLYMSGEITNIEEGVRNTAAHEMVSISNDFIYSKTGYGSRKILDILKEAFTYTDYCIDPERWDYYHDMNKDILSVMQ